MTSKNMRMAASIIFGSAFLFWLAQSARANERHFTHVYESGVLPAGAREIEVWTTARLGRDRFYSRYDQRLEFEVGLTNRLQTAIYLNYMGRAESDLMGGRVSSFEFKGVSSEWKYKVSDPVADAVGFALYGELTMAPSETEVEAKLIFDRRVGNVLLAANVVGELELESEPGEVAREEICEIDLAATYSLSPNLYLGVEARSHNVFVEEAFVASALFAGPVVAYATKSWWVAFSVLPQLPALKKPMQIGNGPLELTDHERVNARLLFSFHL